MYTILLNKQKYTYYIQRQTRKSLQLQLLPNSILLLKAPRQLPLADIIAFIHKKANWIEQKNALFARPSELAAMQSFDEEKTLLFLGKNYRVKVEQTLRKPNLRLTNTEMLVNLYTPANTYLPAFIKDWYKNQALLILTEKTKHWSAKIGTTFNKITIKEQKTRWGSCSSLGNINYNWRIIMAPDVVVDYLVVHEVSHRLFLNHSAAFWNLVAQHSPHYIEHRLWLKQHSHELFTSI